MIDMDRLYHFSRTVGVTCPLADHACFDNASNYVDDNEDLRYCEGLMVDTDTHLAYHHAWAVDLRRGVNWEPTVPEEHAAASDYWGIALTPKQQRRRPADGRGMSYLSSGDIEELADIVRESVRIDEVCHANPARDS